MLSTDTIRIHMREGLSERLLQLKRNWFALFAAYSCLDRHADLERLVDWARKKRLDGPRSHYYNLLFEEDSRLTNLRWKHPRLLILARVLYTTRSLVRPVRKHYPRGFASRYRTISRRHRTT